MLRRAATSARALISRPDQTIDHADVIARLARDSGLSASYCVLTAMSGAIAVLGLLLSSPAVIIGAMLISPLMDPIILFGYSLAVFDQSLIARSLLAIAVGTILAVGLSAAIVWLSPLQTATPEILSRTHPNFFDLLVAVFSGIAGAYAAVLRKGATLVGVAIATALMPPLGVVGFGIATGNSAILDGGAGLFMTNLLAIGLIACLVAKVLGFGSGNSAKTTAWQTIGIVIVFAVLSIPLGLSLKEIATEAVRTSTIRATLKSYFARSSGRVYGVNVSFPKGLPIQAEALVIVRKIDPAAESVLQLSLRQALKSPITLALSQVPMRRRVAPDQQSIDELQRKSDLTPPTMRGPQPDLDMAESISLQTGIPVHNVSENLQTKHILVRNAKLTPDTLSALRRAVASLHEQYPDWTLELRVDAESLPSLFFANNSATLDSSTSTLLSNIVWALQAMNVRAARVVGYSDSSGRRTNNSRMADARAQTVAATLKGAGLEVAIEVDYPVAHQARLEHELGFAQFRRVDIRP